MAKIKIIGYVEDRQDHTVAIERSDGSVRVYDYCDPRHCGRKGGGDIEIKLMAAVGGYRVVEPKGITIKIHGMINWYGSWNPLGGSLSVLRWWQWIRLDPVQPEPKPQTLRDVLPREATGGEYGPSDRFWKHLDRVVMVEHDSFDNPQRWPGTHKNIVAWWELEGGIAVGWNENMSRGWSFPVISYPGKRIDVRAQAADQFVIKAEAAQAEAGIAVDDKRTDVRFPKYGWRVACTWTFGKVNRTYWAQLDGEVYGPYDTPQQRDAKLRALTGAYGQPS